MEIQASAASMRPNGVVLGQGIGGDLLNRHYPNLYHQVFYLLALFVASETYRLILESRSFGHQSSEMIGK